MVVTSRVELSLAATPECVGLIRGEVGDLASAAGATRKTVDDIRLCVSEAVANVVVHAYGSRCGTVLVTADVSGDNLVVVVRDHGTGISSARPGESGLGYGLRIINRLTQHCSVETTPGRGTRVRMLFELGRGRAGDHV